MDKKCVIAIDLDGTLAYWDEHLEDNNQYWKIGEPIMPMINLAKEHIKNGDKVIVFTARISNDNLSYMEMARLKKEIIDWCYYYIGEYLEVTNIKTRDINLFYDDKAIHVEKNTGRIIGDKL